MRALLWHYNKPPQKQNMEGRHIYTFVMNFPEGRKNRSCNILFFFFWGNTYNPDANVGLHPWISTALTLMQQLPWSRVSRQRGIPLSCSPTPNSSFADSHTPSLRNQLDLFTPKIHGRSSQLTQSKCGAHTYSPRTQETEAGGLPWVWSQPKEWGPVFKKQQT